MSSETNDRSIDETQREMDKRADRMESRVEELGEHADEAAKKSEVTQRYASPKSDDLDNVGDWESMASTDEDPSSAVGDDDAQDRSS